MTKVSSSISLEELERLEANGELGYRQPDNQVLLDLADSQVQNPALSVSPNRQWMAMYQTPKYTPFAQCKNFLMTLQKNLLPPQNQLQTLNSHS